MPLFKEDIKCFGVVWSNSNVEDLDGNVVSSVDFDPTGCVDSNCMQECQDKMMEDTSNVYMSHWIANNGRVHCNFAPACKRGFGTGWQVYQRRFEQVLATGHLAARCVGSAVTQRFGGPGSDNCVNACRDSNGKCGTANCNMMDKRDFGVKDCESTQSGCATDEYRNYELCESRAAFSNAIHFSIRATNCNVRTRADGCTYQKMGDSSRWSLYSLFPGDVVNVPSRRRL